MPELATHGDGKSTSGCVAGGPACCAGAAGGVIGRFPMAAVRRHYAVQADIWEGRNCETKALDQAMAEHYESIGHSL